MPEKCICIECGKEFEVSAYKKDTAKYCSRECMNKHHKGQRRGEWITKICPSCGIEFETLKSKEKKYCSEKCNKERNEKYMIYHCDSCGKEMRIKKILYQELLDGKRKTITCSRKCMGKTKETGHDVTCLNCGKVFHRRQYHIDRHENVFCSNKCQGEYNHKLLSEDRECEFCGKKFHVLKSSPQRFCGTECQKKWQTTLTSEKSPNYCRITVPCDCCGKELKIIPSKFKSGQHNFCDEKCRQSWYANVFSQSTEWKNKMRAVAIKSLEKGSLNTATKPQLIINELLDSLGIKYINEKGFVYYAVDNYLPDSNLIIEIMGNYWHASPLKKEKDKLNSTQRESVRRDKAKHTYIKNYHNIEILYLWEKDIYDNIDTCKKLILKYIETDGQLANYHSFNYYLDQNSNLKLSDTIIVPYQEQSSEK